MPDDIEFGQQIEQTSPSVLRRLMDIQLVLKVEKGQWNAFSKFSYRSKEDILEAAKPLCHEHGLTLLCEDEIVMVGDWHYAKATAAVVDADTGERVEAHGWAREDETKKGMDGSQITGTASSYAGKRALGNLFALDDTKDSDYAPSKQEPPAQGGFNAHCQSCGTAYHFDSQQQYNDFLKSPGGCMCPNKNGWVVG